ncbi:MAG TPA: PaaI family thioesterase [Chlamydiales bacterium]|nr:PaaI family thioesterase [Chlamydiales bacterium]
MIWKTPIDLANLNDSMKNTLVDHLGIRFTEVKENALIATMEIHQKHMQPFGIMHGGASCVLAETVGSTAANFCVEAGKICVGLEININHLRPVQSGILTATATVLHQGKTTQVWDIKIHNEENKLVAVSRHTVAVIEKK